MGITKSKSKSKPKSNEESISKLSSNTNNSLQADQKQTLYGSDKIMNYKPIAPKTKNHPIIANNLGDIAMELLVFGYAHINEQLLSAPLNIVPLSIIQIFMKYFCIESDLRIFLSVSQGKNHEKKNKYKYIDFANNETVTLSVLNEDVYTNHLNKSINPKSIFAEHITIQPYLFQHSTEFFNEESNYSAIIENATNIIYINNSDISNISDSDTDILNGFRTAIPYGHGVMGRNSVYEYLYSVNNGLIHFANRNMKCLHFEGNIHDYDQWEWMELGQTNFNHRNGSLCWVRGYSFNASDSDINEKIFMCGGQALYQASTMKCELFDISKRKLISLCDMPNMRLDAGCFFDTLNKNVYVAGGGSGSKYAVDCYDFDKDYWYSLPDTSFPHNNRPMLYMNGYILYIVGNGNAIGSIEMYDTRDSFGTVANWKFARDLQIDNMIAKDPCTIYKIMSNRRN